METSRCMVACRTLAPRVWATAAAIITLGCATEPSAPSLPPSAQPPPSKLAFIVQPGDATAGSAIAPPVQVRAEDALGNLSTAGGGVIIAISLGTNPGNARLAGRTTVGTNSGVATFGDLSLDKAGGGYTLVASASGLTGATSSPFAVTPAVARELTFILEPSNVTAGVAISPAIQVTVRDAFGNTATGFTGNVSLAIGTNAGGGSLSGTATMAAVAGVATFADLSIDRPGGAYTLVASASGLASATTNAFAVAVGSTSFLPIDPTPGAEMFGQPSISFNGESFLVVWRDTSVVPYEFHVGRVTPGAVVLDPGGRLIGTTATRGYGVFPGVAFDGTNHMVVWAEGGDVLAVRVSKDGVPLDSPPLVVGSGSKVRPVSIAFNGTNYLVGWRTLSDQIRVTRVSPAGAVLDAVSGLFLGNGFYPWIGTDGQDFLVVWEGWGASSIDIYANRVSGGGAVLDGSGFVVSQDPEAQDKPSLAFNGTEYLVVWHDARGGDVGYNDGTVRATRVSTSGTVLHAPVLVSGVCCGGVGHSAFVASDGTDFLVTWQADSGGSGAGTNAYARRVSASGQPLGSAFPVIEAPGNQWTPMVAFGGLSYLVVWTEGGPQQGAPPTGVWGRVFVPAHGDLHARSSPRRSTADY